MRPLKLATWGSTAMASHDTAVNVTLIWDLEKYDEGMARLDVTKDPEERKSIIHAMDVAGCSTSFGGMPLNDYQDRVVKFFDLNRSNEHYHEVIKQFLHEVALKVGREVGYRVPYAWELSWQENRHHKRLRYVINRARDGKPGEVRLTEHETTHIH